MNFHPNGELLKILICICVTDEQPELTAQPTL